LLYRTSPALLLTTSEYLSYPSLREEKTLTSRERVAAAVEFRGPDRIPFRSPGLPSDPARAQALQALYDRYPSDFTHPTWPKPEGPPRPRRQSDQYVDDWGCRWERRPPNVRQVIGYPLEDWADFATYQFPKHQTPERYAQADQLTREQANHKYVLTGAGSLFERMQYLRGFENLMVDLAENRKEIHVLLDRMVEHYLHDIQE